MAAIAVSTSVPGMVALSVILALGSLRQDYCSESEANLGCIVNPSLKNQTHKCKPSPVLTCSPNCVIWTLYIFLSGAMLGFPMHYPGLLPELFHLSIHRCPVSTRTCLSTSVLCQSLVKSPEWKWMERMVEVERGQLVFGKFLRATLMWQRALSCLDHSGNSGQMKLGDRAGDRMCIADRHERGLCLPRNTTFLRDLQG